MVNWNHHEEPAVYALHAGDSAYAYVGSTSVNVIARMYHHRYRARKGHPAAIYDWMRSVGIDSVICDVIAYEPDKELRESLEVSTIAQFKAAGFPLRNKIWFPGDGLAVASKEHRRIVNKSPLAGFPREPKVKLERVPKHGTATEYTKYKCRCDVCVDGYEAYMAERLGRPFVTKIHTMRAQDIHGTVACYKNGLCRCIPCSKANREYKRSLRERKRAA